MQKMLGLRERADYLRKDEIEKIKSLLPNPKVSIYTFENYIYHPDNIAELNFAGDLTKH
jgi:hypothetical protein